MPSAAFHSLLFSLVILLPEAVVHAERISDKSGENPVIYADTPLHAAPGELLQFRCNTGSPITRVNGAAIKDSESSRLMPKLTEHPSSGSLQSDVELISQVAKPCLITVKWPAFFDSDRTFSITVQTASGTWSNPLAVNREHVLWFSPAVLSSNGTVNGLPRELLVVGRNLRSVRTRLRLRATDNRSLRLEPVNGQSAVPSEFELRFKLPSHLPAGLYHVDYSDDGQHWSSVEDQTLQVVDQPSQAEVLELDSPAYGKCKPDDDADDTPCLIRALHAAQSTGATVHLGRGIWDFSGVVIHNECIVVPGNVSMTGEADGSSTVNYHPASDASHRALLCLSGNNHLQHLRFTQTATTSAAQPHAFVQLGTVDAHSVPETVSNIVVSRNDFTNSNAAIIDSGHALRNLTIVNNLFSIDGTALNLNGNRYMVSTTFLIADTTITQNVFMPPEHAPLDPQHGPIAAELGASLRMNFSRNRVTVNSANHYGKQGWRAGFFWSMNGNNTNLLIAENSVECSGAGGDGEAIALDSNANTYGYAGLQSVIAADNRSISVAAVPNDRQNGQRVDVNNYYTGHWLQIVSGTGIGQSRQIVGYQLDRVHQSARYFVQPAFSVIPSSEDSRIIITRLFNNAMILGNTIDNRNSQCSHHSRTRNQDINAGSISLWAPSVGTIIAHNVQYQTNGIMVQHTYSVPAQGCRQCENSVIRQQSLEIVGNNISGTFHIPGICAKTGIHLRVGAAPTPDHLPPLLNLGTRISQNQIQASQSDLLDGGIGVPLVWYYGPAQFHGSLLLGVIIEDNRIAGMENSTDSDSCPIKKYSVGINLSIPHATNYSHLHDNQCNGLRKTLVDHGSNTKRICYGNHVSCECR